MAERMVLLVEDDDLARRAYERVLGDEYTVRGVVTGSEAMECVRTQRFDAIVSDIDVPGMNGLALLQAVRERDAALPVVLVTGHPSVETARDAVNLGAFSYLTKPVDPDTLRAAVARACQVRTSFTPFQTHAPTTAADHQRLDRALSSLWIAFQPIVSMRERRVVGYEALMRNDEPSLARPPDVLTLAESLRRLADVGRTTRARIADAVHAAPADARIFVNLHPTDLVDDALFAAESPLAGHAQRVVLEVTERASLQHLDDLADRIAHLRASGYRIAIDDLGAGYAGLTSVSALEPDVVKLDMSLVRDVHKSRTKQQLVTSFCRLGNDLGMEVVCEGVETAVERDCLLGLGAEVLQGYLFGRPHRGFGAVAL